MMRWKHVVNEVAKLLYHCTHLSPLPPLSLLSQPLLPPPLLPLPLPLSLNYWAQSRCWPSL